MMVNIFTIVLNGKPFIEHHINVFSKLKHEWHWHIVEGVGDLKYDTAWSLQYGASIDGSMHEKGLSKDGTTEYIDRLKLMYPDKISVYRKPENVFWDGKLEMVNAPLKTIKDESILWEIDADELWTAEQIDAGIEMFVKEPSKMAAFFLCYFFVGENKYISSTNTYGNNLGYEWVRAWHFKPGDVWMRHEPPKLCRRSNDQWVDVAEIDCFSHEITAQHSLIFQHFAYMYQEQVLFKELYYGYKNAVQQWRRLQEVSSLPVKLKDYFEWVKDDAIVDDFLKLNIENLSEEICR